MNLDSIAFLYLFLPIMLLINFITPKKYKHVIILFFSLLFFILLQPQMTPVLIVFCLSDYVFGFVMSKTHNKILKTSILTMSIIFNVAVFVLSQYLDLIPFIIGVSVVSLVKITYIISIYLNKISSTDNIIVYLSNVLCFPCLIAGPINDYSDISFRIKNGEKNFSRFGDGATEVIHGLFKKVVIADTMSVLISKLSVNGAIPYDSFGAWFWTIAHLFELTYTLLGYSQMARGICKMLGFDIKSNFNYPFMATSVKDFFRNFNTSLNTFAKKYIYIPLGGSRNGKLCMITSTLAATLLTTIWYGFSLNTVMCAFYFAVIIIFEKLLSKGVNKSPKFILTLLTIVCLTPGFLMLITNEPQDFSYLVSSMLGQNYTLPSTRNSLYYVGNYAPFLIIATLLLFNFSNRIYKFIKKTNKTIYIALYSIYNIGILAICTAFMF